MRSEEVCVEIERKYRVTEVPSPLPEGEPISQGYLVIAPDGSEVRVRRKGGRCFQTLKRGSGLVREEVEVELSEQQFGALWPATESRRLEKTRYAVPFEDHTIELDIFEGPLAGLVTAEVEFASEADSRIFRPPAWFGHEITNDERYRNQQLVLEGRPPHEGD